MPQVETIDRALDSLDDQFSQQFKQMAKAAFDEAVQKQAEQIVFEKVSQYRDIIAEQGAVAIEKTLTERIGEVIAQVTKQVTDQLTDQYQQQFEQYKQQCDNYCQQIESDYQDQLEQIKDHYKKQLKQAVEVATVQNDSIFQNVLDDVQDQLQTIEQKIDNQGRIYEQVAEAAAKKFVQENKVALVEAEKAWLGETFINHFKNLYEQFDIKSPENINIYQKKIKQLSREKDDLYNQLSEQVDLNDKINDQLLQAKKQNIVTKAIESLTESQKSKVCTLLEQVQIDDIDKFAQYAHKVADSINTSSNTQRQPRQMLTEQDHSSSSFQFGIVTDKPVSEPNSVQRKVVDPDVASVLHSLSRYKNQI